VLQKQLPDQTQLRDPDLAHSRDFLVCGTAAQLALQVTRHPLHEHEFLHPQRQRPLYLRTSWHFFWHSTVSKASEPHIMVLCQEHAEGGRVGGRPYIAAIRGRSHVHASRDLPRDHRPHAHGGQRGEAAVPAGS